MRRLSHLGAVLLAFAGPSLSAFAGCRSVAYSAFDTSLETSLADSASADPSPAPQSPGSSSIPHALGTIEQESSERDITYLKSRVTFRYDYKDQEGDVITNRFRLKTVIGFGPHQRYGVSLNVPVLHRDTPEDSATGLGDVELQFGSVIQSWRKFRYGAALQVTFQTATNDLLGGGTTSLKPAWGFTATPSKRFEVNCAFNYKRSIHTTRGDPVNEFEPDCTANTRILKSTMWLESDSFYEFGPGQWAPTLKLGLSRRFGEGKQWVLSPYFAFPVNEYARQSQYRYNVGLDLGFFFHPAR